MIKKHSSLLLMLLASFCTFLTNVFIKNYTEPTVYSFFIILQIFIGYVFTLSYLGADSVLLRFCELKNNKIEVSKFLMIQMLFSWLIASLVLPILYYLIVANEDGFFNLLIIFVLASALFLLSIFSRLLGGFFKSQMLLNFWKIILLLTFSIFYICGYDINILNLVNVFIFSFFLSLALYIKDFFRFSKILIVTPDRFTSKKSHFVFQYSFFLSFLFFAVLGSFDRIFLESVMSVSDFSDFAYLFTLLIFPIGIIANYIGYKEFVNFKSAGKIDLKNSIFITVFYTTLVYVLYCFILFLLRDYLNLKFDIYLFLSAFVIAICKVPYSFLSSIIGARGNTSDILNINHMSLFILIVVCSLNLLVKNVYFCVFSISIIWVIRLFLYYVKSKNYIR